MDKDKTKSLLIGFLWLIPLLSSYTMAGKIPIKTCITCIERDDESSSSARVGQKISSVTAGSASNAQQTYKHPQNKPFIAHRNVYLNPLKKREDRDYVIRRSIDSDSHFYSLEFLGSSAHRNLIFLDPDQFERKIKFLLKLREDL